MTSEPMNVTADVVQGLADKLEALDLSPVEAQLLDVLFARAEAAGDDVQGFGVVFEVETTGFKGSDEELQAAVPKLSRALGFHIHINPFIGETEKN